jgi:hypothetical protein
VTGPATRTAPRPQPEGDPASFVVMGWGGPGGITPYGLARRSLGSLGPVWAPAWATTPVTATARTDLADAHSAVATLHGRLRRVEPAWSRA